MQPVQRSPGASVVAVIHVLRTTPLVVQMLSLTTYFLFMHTQCAPTSGQMGQETMMKKSCKAGNALADDGDGRDISQPGVPSVAGGNKGVRVGRGNVHIADSPWIMYPGTGDKLDHALAAIISSVGRGDTFVPSSSALHSLLSPANNDSHGGGLLDQCLSVEGNTSVDFAIVISRNSGKAQRGSNTTTTSAAPVADLALGEGVHASEPEEPSPAPLADDDARPAGAAAHEDGAVIHDDDGDGPALDEAEDTRVSQGTCAGHIADVSSPDSNLQGWLSWMAGWGRTGLEFANEAKEAAASFTGWAWCSMKDAVSQGIKWGKIAKETADPWVRHAWCKVDDAVSQGVKCALTGKEMAASFIGRQLCNVRDAVSPWVTMVLQAGASGAVVDTS